MNALYRIAALLLLLATAVILAFPADATPLAIAPPALARVPYNPHLDAEREAFFHVLVRTKWCMADAARIGARQGMRDALLTSFVARACESAVRAHLMHYNGFTHRQASVVIAALADREAQAVLEDGR